MKIQKFKKMGGGGGVGSGGIGLGVGCQGGCERRSEVIVKIQKKMGGGDRAGGPIRGLGGGGGHSKVRARWVMWAMGDVNLE